MAKTNGEDLKEAFKKAHEDTKEISKKLFREAEKIAKRAKKRLAEESGEMQIQKGA